MGTDLVLHLCAPCLSGSGKALFAEIERALDEAAIDARVGSSPCLGPCDRPAVLAVQGGGSAYVFADVRLPEDIGDLVATCRACRDAPGGWIEDARPCGRLRFCLHARVPGP